ncbi:carboxy-S-adenosyl-L-methionine synthase CmoA [Congregibacter sp.]|uniref:carboxy-S-adenosyl-L-methionine synthase CmoA n=1 Tax=Congregibacter sp. TaxID=2744308 RepID=UPI003F6A9FB2
MTEKSTQPKADTLFSDPLRAPGPFRFDSEVVSVFPDMIRRSVPGYETVIAMSGLLAGRFARPESVVYDLGCSLGASTLSMRQHIDVPDCKIIGIDNSSAMIARCQDLIALDTQSVEVELREEDLLQSNIENASMVVLNYTLQFVPMEERPALLARIADALLPGGILVLSEKVVFPDASLNQLNIDLHHDFKRAHGYSDLEIAGKRDSIENVLVPESIEQHRQRLADAGFSSSDVWFQCFNFASIIALK